MGICRFLGALVNEGKMAVKTSYHRDELRDVTIAAGLDPATTEEHIQSNFKDIPSGLIDIFDMEGLPNEHWTSTGINDCTTHVSNCRTHRDGHKVCSTSTPDKMCGTPNAALFDNFFRLADVNDDNVLTSAELANVEGKVQPNDFNAIGEGTISGSHQFLIDIFGDNQQSITREALPTSLSHPPMGSKQTMGVLRTCQPSTRVHTAAFRLDPQLTAGQVDIGEELCATSIL